MQLKVNDGGRASFPRTESVSLVRETKREKEAVEVLTKEGEIKKLVANDQLSFSLYSRTTYNDYNFVKQKTRTFTFTSSDNYYYYSFLFVLCQICFRVYKCLL